MTRKAGQRTNAGTPRHSNSWLAAMHRGMLASTRAVIPRIPCRIPRISFLETLRLMRSKVFHEAGYMPWGQAPRLAGLVSSSFRLPTSHF